MVDLSGTLETYHDMFSQYFTEYRKARTNTYTIIKTTDSREMWRAAEEAGLDVVASQLPSNRMLISDGSRNVGFAGAQPSEMKPALSALCEDKLVQKHFYRLHGIPHAEGHEVHSVAHALESRRELGGSIVIKPSQGRQGLGVTVDVRTDEALVEAWNYARRNRAQSPIMIEKTFVGCDLRAIILDGEIICAYLKLPPNVVGDGQSTVADLVERKNDARLRSPALRVSMVKTDRVALDLLERQDLTLTSIPPKDTPALRRRSPPYYRAAFKTHRRYRLLRCEGSRLRRTAGDGRPLPRL